MFRFTRHGVPEGRGEYNVDSKYVSSLVEYPPIANKVQVSFLLVKLTRGEDDKLRYLLHWKVCGKVTPLLDYTTATLFGCL